MNKYTKQITSIAIVIGILVITGAASLYFLTLSIDKQQPGPAPAQNPTVTAPKEPQLPKSDELFTLINGERVKDGLRPLALDTRLSQSATDKCNDMVARNYWAHDTPEGVEPWKFIQKYVNSYYGAGENLAAGFSTSQDTVTGWMKSTGHRENILNPKYDHVGYAVCHSDDFDHNGDTYVIVQHLADE